MARVSKRLRPRRVLASSVPEIELLRVCARNAGSLDRQHIQKLVAQGLRWDYLLEAADRHGMVPLLYRNLAQQHRPEVVPDRCLRKLEEHFQSNLRRNLRLLHELIAILRTFRDHEIVAVPYKGPFLALILWGNIGVRESSDLDILISRKDFPAARRLLENMGYQPDHHLTAAEEVPYLWIYHERAFRNPESKIRVELQWEIVPRYMSIAFGPEQLWDSLQLTEVSAEPIPVVAPEDLLLVLSVHGWKHGWNRLIWLADIAQLLRLYPWLNWRQVFCRCREVGAERILLLGLSLSDRLLGPVLPDEVRRRVAEDPKVGKLVQQVCAAMATGYELGYVQLHIFLLRGRERWRDKVRHLVRLALTPGLGEWALLQLPARLAPLYRILRVYRVFTKSARMALQIPMSGS